MTEADTMTNAGSAGQTFPTIDMLAHRAVSEPGSLSQSDIVRLASWKLDHCEHVRAHQAAISSATAWRFSGNGLDDRQRKMVETYIRKTSPGERLAAQAPPPPADYGSETKRAADLPQDGALADPPNPATEQPAAFHVETPED